MHIVHEVPLFLAIFDIFNTAVRTKLRAIVPKANYVNPITLKLKTFIFNNNSKIIYIFCICGSNTSPVGEDNFPGEEILVFLERMPRNTQN